jgi:hypothetical protein
VGGREVLMEAKSVTKLLKEADASLAVDRIFDDLVQHGLKGIWLTISDDEKEAFKKFVWNKCSIAKEDKNEYAYYFWNRMGKRLVEGKLPIGEEHE